MCVSVCVEENSKLRPPSPIYTHLFVLYIYIYTTVPSRAHANCKPPTGHAVSYLILVTRTSRNLTRCVCVCDHRPLFARYPHTAGRRVGEARKCSSRRSHRCKPCLWVLIQDIHGPRVELRIRSTLRSPKFVVHIEHPELKRRQASNKKETSSDTQPGVAAETSPEEDGWHAVGGDHRKISRNTRVAIGRQVRRTLVGVQA